MAVLKTLEKITSMSQLQTHLGAILELVVGKAFGEGVPICATAVLVWLRGKLFNDGKSRMGQSSFEEGRL